MSGFRVNEAGRLQVGARAPATGMMPEAGDVERLTAQLCRPLRSYRDFASEVAAAT